MLTSTPQPAARATARCDAARIDPSADHRHDTREALALGEVALVRCPGPRFGGPAAAAFARSLLTAPRLALDLGDVRAIDAAGLVALAALGRACRARGGALRLSAPTPAVRALLASVGLHHDMDVFHTSAPAAVV